MSGYSKLREIYDNEGSFNGKELTEQAKQQLSTIDFSDLKYDDLLQIKKLNKLPPDFINNLFKGFMRRQDEFLSTMSGHFIYTQCTNKESLQQLFSILDYPNPNKDSELIVTNILRRIASGGDLNSQAPLKPIIDADNFDNGIIRFYHSMKTQNKEHEAKFLFDFKPSTYYTNTSVQEPFFVVGFPPFMKVRLTSFTLMGPPEIPNRNSQGGLRNWEIWASNDWNEIIVSGRSKKIFDIANDQNLRGPNKSHEYQIQLDKDQYYRYFRFVASGEQHQGDAFIFLSGIDLSGNIKICNE